MSNKGRFRPKNPQKYKGDATNIIYRSTWEIKVMRYLDENPNIIWWGSEELPIPYFNPIDKKKHRYFPDFVAKVRKTDGKVMTYVIEVKPEKQTKPPTQKRKTKTSLQESATYEINKAKWYAAEEFCKDHGWQFLILTEKHLGI
jgi:restriction endonuclease